MRIFERPATNIQNFFFKERRAPAAVVAPHGHPPKLQKARHKIIVTYPEMESVNL
jgi:hypothetical protein